MSICVVRFCKTVTLMLLMSGKEMHFLCRTIREETLCNVFYAGCRQAWRTNLRPRGTGPAPQTMRAPTIRRRPTPSTFTPLRSRVFRSFPTWEFLRRTRRPATSTTTAGWVFSGASSRATVAPLASRTRRSWKTQMTGLNFIYSII